MRGLLINHHSKYYDDLSILFNDNCDIVSYTHFNIDHAKQYDYFILSGGEINISKEEDIAFEKLFLKTCNKPIFGVCLGMQILSIIAGEKLNELANGRRIGTEPFTFSEEVGELQYNHGWFINSIPNGYECIIGDDNILRCIYNDRVLAFQGHPELSGEFGLKLKEYFFKNM